MKKAINKLVDFVNGMIDKSQSEELFSYNILAILSFEERFVEFINKDGNVLENISREVSKRLDWTSYRTEEDWELLCEENAREENELRLMLGLS